ncbi:MAG: hypothetical protein LC624_11510, partial [Halobacteriales archaeon]|nr:hypothetical protein [Halobacteriales archaeon]
MRVAPVLVLAFLLVGCAKPPAVGHGPAASAAPAFDGEAAYAFVRAQVCEPGTGLDPPCMPRYRIPGTDGNNATAELLRSELQHAGWRVGLDPFTA